MTRTLSVHLSSVIVLFSMVAAPLILSAGAQQAQPLPLSVHNLNTGLDYTTVQAAISAPETLDGDTIHVDAGAYEENVAVTKQLRLIGDGPEVTHITAADSNKLAINVSSSNVVIRGFNVTGSTASSPIFGCGVRLSAVSNVNFSNNYVHGNQYGIYLAGSTDVTLSNTTVTANIFVGIYLEHAANCSLIGNRVSSNGEYGFVIWQYSEDNTVAHNVVAANARGITLGYSDHNTLAYNDILENTEGIEIQHVSNDNTIYQNNLVNNAIQAGGYQMNVSLNAWDNGYPSGGNYWSDYSDVDAYKGAYQNVTGRDGVWDHPYVIDSDNQDRYASTTPFRGPAGDVDGDRDVDIFDIVTMAGAYQATYPDPRYNRLCDMDLDGDVDIFDIVAAAGNYNKHW